MNEILETEWNGLTINYRIEDMGAEGDGDVPGGINDLGPCISWLEVFSQTGADLTDYLTKYAMIDIEEYIWSKQ